MCYYRQEGTVYPAFVSLSVCVMLATLHKNCTDRIFIKLLQEMYHLVNKVTIKFWKSSRSGPSSRNFEIILPLWDGGNSDFFDISAACQQILMKFSWSGGTSYTTSNKSFDFGAAPDHDPDPGIFQRKFYQCATR